MPKAKATENRALDHAMSQASPWCGTTHSQPPKIRGEVVSCNYVSVDAPRNSGQRVYATVLGWRAERAILAQIDPAPGPALSVGYGAFRAEIESAAPDRHAA